MAGTRLLVPLIYRADWTTWSISAEVIRLRSQPFGLAFWARSSYRMLIAPGGRYRVEAISSPGHQHLPEEEQVTLIVCDGPTCSVIWGREGEAGPADPHQTPMDDIVRPAWLLPQLRLTTLDMADFAGRPAYHVAGEFRRSLGGVADSRSSHSSADLHVDAELGLVLRQEFRRDGVRCEVIELGDVIVDPPEAHSAASFRPPAEVEIDDLRSVQPPFGRTEFGQHRQVVQGLSNPFPGRAGDVAVGLGAGAVRMATRQPVRPQPRSAADDEPGMPAVEPEPARRMPVTDKVLNLMAGSGAPPVSLTAELHQWVDKDVARHGPFIFSGTEILHGFYGPAGFWAQMRAPHRLSRLLVATPGRYRIDYQIDERPGQALTVACDGDKLRSLYADRLTVSPAEPLPPEFAHVLDCAWLLGNWQLHLAGQAVIGARPAMRIIAEPVPGQLHSEDANAGFVISALLDSEFGFIHRQISYVGDQPAMVFELRNVVIASEDEAGDFSIDPAAGMPVTGLARGQMHDVALPEPVKAAAEAVASALNGAQAGARWLTSQIGRARDNQMRDYRV